MVDQRLTQAQRNEVYRILKETGRISEPASVFEWSEEYLSSGGQQLKVSLLMSLSGELFCRFGVRRTESGYGFVLTWRPGEKVPVESVYPSDWEAACFYHLPQWAVRAKLELGTVDLWTQAAKAAKPLSALMNTAPEPFSPDELPLLDAKLDALEQHIEQTSKPSGPQKTAIHTRFAYLKAAARRATSRIDWLNILVGQITAMAAERLFDPSLLGSIMTQAHNLLMHLPQIQNLLPK